VSYVLTVQDVVSDGWIVFVSAPALQVKVCGGIFRMHLHTLTFLASYPDSEKKKKAGPELIVSKKVRPKSDKHISFHVLLFREHFVEAIYVYLLRLLSTSRHGTRRSKNYRMPRSRYRRRSGMLYFP
jgi:hypothetical protein